MQLLNRYAFYFLLFFVFFKNTICKENSAAEIIIRPAILADISSALDMDWRVSIEYFKPLFINHYSDTLGKDPDYYLTLDCENDEAMFLSCLNSTGSEKLYIAFDGTQQQVAGLILFHKENTALEIDLLLVDKNYRKMGLGKKLIGAALETYKECQTCIAYCFSHNEESLAFYKSLGFGITGPGPEDRITVYGISYAQLYVCCTKIMNSAGSF